MTRWQHTIPQREQDHEVRPYTRVSGRGPVRCMTCDKPIKRVAADDGPEGLKALLSFR